MACGGGHQDRPVWLDAFSYGQTVRSISTTERVVAITIDDGPIQPYTGQMLDILREKEVKATFFVVGVNATRFPRALLRIVEEGHAVGNHTWSHPLLGSLTPEWVLAEIERGAEVIETLSGVRPKLFRPPGGDMGDAAVLRRTCRRLECLTVTWSVDGRDDDDAQMPDPDEIVERVLRLAEPGSIVLLHDGDGLRIDSRRGPTVLALSRIIDGLRARGYEFVTVPDLLALCAGSDC